MGVKFVISHLDEQMGPFEEHELKAKWVKGELLPIDYVFDDVKQDWVLLTEKFVWAAGKSETATPPPLREISVKKKRPDLTPVPEIAPTAPTLTSQKTQVQLHEGVGELDLALAHPGQVELVLRDADLSLEQPLKIKVNAAEPFAIEWTMPHQHHVGEDVEIRIRALDRSGHLCNHYEDKFLVRASGGSGREFPVHMVHGECVLKVQHTKAETWTLSFHYSGNRVLKLPGDKTVEWLPGPAAKLILDGPTEYVAGRPIKVHVRAVDRWGNLAKSFSGTVVLEVKAS